MNYKYPPIYKYGLLLLTIYMFIKHQKILTPDKILFNSVLIVLIVFIFDNIIIRDHPNLLEDVEFSNISSKKQDDDDDDFEKELSDDELDEIINSYDNDIESRFRSRQNYSHNNHNDFNQISVDMRKSQCPYSKQREYFNSDMILY